VKAVVRSYLASQHLWTAIHCSRECARIEAELEGGDKPLHPTQRSMAMATVLSSVSFLEALVNEVYEDAVHAGRAAPPDPRHWQQLAILWREGERLLSVLDKFQLALVATGNRKFEPGLDPFQSTKLLVKWRNALVHSKPDSHDIDAPTRLELQLSQRFPKSSLLKENDGSGWTFWALAAPGAEWAVRTAREFGDDWCERMGLPPTHNDAIVNFEREAGSTE
jgi:hypothetical protein